MTHKQAIKNFRDAAKFLQEQAKQAIKKHKDDDAKNFQELAKYHIKMADWWEVIYGDNDGEVGTADIVGTADADPGGQPPIPPPPPPPPIG